MMARRTPLIIIASGGLGREVAAMVRVTDEHELIGFVDHDSSRWGKSVAGVLVLGDLATVTHYPDVDVALCAGRGRARQLLVDNLLDLGVDDRRFATLVDPSVRMGPETVIGAGSIVLAGCVLTTDVKLGQSCVLMPNVTLTHDDVVEDFATLCAGVTVAGSVVIGARSYLGQGATVREKVRVGRDVTVGMASAVLHDVPNGETWVGVPARRVTLGDRAGVR